MTIADYAVLAGGVIGLLVFVFAFNWFGMP